jgi:DNA-binding transcriptional LysR family regulator
MSISAKKPLQRRHIEALVSIADHGSVHRAALSLGMPQPALSRLLSEAEDRLGARVFERSVHGSKPTTRGKAVIGQARFVLRGIERLDTVIDASGSTVRLGCIPRAMHSVMPYLLNRVHSQSPEDRASSGLPVFRMNVVEDSSILLFDALYKEKLDFAIMRHVAGASGIGNNFTVERLYEERPLIVCSAENQAFGKRTIDLAILAGQEWILPSLETTSRAVLDRFWNEQGLPPIRSVIETRTFESNLALVADTPFISIVPESIARRYAGLGLIKILNVRPALPANTVMLVYNHAIKADSVLEPFRQMIHTAAQDALKNF